MSEESSSTLLTFEARLAAFRVDAGRLNLLARRLLRERKAVAGRATTARALVAEKVRPGEREVVFREGVRRTRATWAALLKTAPKREEKGEPPNAGKGSELLSHRFAV